MKRLLAVLLLVTGVAGGQNHSFRVNDGRFLLDGQPFQVLAGEMHYARVPREYWRDRLRKARAMGLNAITTYVFWNLHEPRPGVYNFRGQLDVAEFIREAQQEGLWVILRPGPYVCSEWDLGGLPAWLLADPKMQLRSREPGFLRPGTAYLKRLGQELAPLQITRGGPIIMVQVENEYGSFGDDHDYVRAVRDAMVAAGFDQVLETADGPSQFARGSLPDLPVVANFGPGTAKKAFAAIDKFRPGNPHMAGEWWAGWFDQWGEPHQRTDAAQEAGEMDWMLSQGASFSIYMWHGGTTFGFMNGANWEDQKGYRPQTTSYDYDAALDEAGRVTRKYLMFRDVLARHAPQPLPEIPAPQPIMAIPPFELPQASALWDHLPKPIVSATPRPMESLGQSYGYIAYRTRLSGGAGELVVDEPRDYAQVYVDGKLAGSLDRRLQQTKLNVACEKPACELTVLVENTGRINFGRQLRDDRKGITRAVFFAGRELRGWQIFPLPMDSVAGVSDPSTHGPETRATPHQSGPAFYRGTFTVTHPGDTFLDLRGWGKGQVWVNGHNLGRFWSIGPQQTLYLPAPWLKPGANEVIVFALGPPQQLTLRGLKEPVLDEVH